MTESTLPFGTSDGSGDGSQSGRNRQLMLVLVAALAVAIGVGAWFLLRGGDDGSATVAVPRPVTTATTTPTPTPTPQASAPAVPPAANVPVGHNPFKPLVVQPADNAAPGGSEGTPAVTPGATPGAPSNSLPTSTTPQSLTLNSVDVDKKTVAITLNGKPLVATSGQVFGSYFRLIGVVTVATDPIQYGAVFQYGDQSIQLYVGDSIDIGS